MSRSTDDEVETAIVRLGKVVSSAGDFKRRSNIARIVGTPPPFRAIIASLDANPQLMRWTAIRAQRDAELLAARLKPIPDVRVTAGWRHYRDTNDNAVRLGLSIPIPVFDRTYSSSHISSARLSR